MVMYQEANCLCDAKNPGLTLKLPEQAQILLRAILILILIIIIIIITNFQVHLLTQTKP